MPADDDDFRRSLLATFAIEAEEHLSAIERVLIELEKPENRARSKEMIDTAFREAHSLKGAARAVDFRKAESLCHKVESVFETIRGSAALPRAGFDVLHAAAGMLRSLIQAESGTAPFPDEQVAQALGVQIDALAGHAAVPEISLRQAAPEAAAEAALPLLPNAVVRVNRQELNTLLLGAEEFLTSGLVANQSRVAMEEIGALVKNHRRARARQAKRLVATFRRGERGAATVDAQRFAQRFVSAAKLIREDDEMLLLLERRLGALSREFGRQQESLSKDTRRLIEVARRLSMLPVASVTDTFPKMVRDLARDLGKEVTLEISGDAVEVDRRILEQIKDPLVHLLRNAVGHGIEPPALRESRSKGPQGTLTLKIAPSDRSLLEIIVADDGAGIDVQVVRANATRADESAADAISRMTEEEAMNLIFRPRVSTSSMITDVFGRGMGLAIVREKIERLGGTVTVESVHGAGTAFRLLVPSTLYAFKGVRIRCASKHFLLPLSSIERALRIGKDAVKVVDGMPTLAYRETTLPIVRLDTLLRLGRSGGLDAPRLALVILAVGDRKVALEVSEIVGQEEVMVKSVGPFLADEKLVAGASTLASGMNVIVLDPYELITLALTPGESISPSAPTDASTGVVKRVLVADDSITSRMLIKATLEAEGYAVTTAVDGKDALDRLHRDAYDIVVSDVEMPKINGFELTKRIREDQALRATPVVLVTALASRQDQERGLNAGASAYLVKSDFNGGNLVDVLRRLA